MTRFGSVSLAALTATALASACSSPESELASPQGTSATSLSLAANATDMNSGPWFGAEVRSSETFGRPGVPLRVTWTAKPAQGNCVITDMALFNGDRIFNTNQGHWSEITFEVFGGSAARGGSVSAFQTQYITYQNPSDAPTARGLQHMGDERVGGNVAQIWDGAFHAFQIEWKPGDSSNAYVVFRLDGQELRRESGGDVGRIEPGLQLYQDAWMVKTDNVWGVTDGSRRPDASTAIYDSIAVDEWDGARWNGVKTFRFGSESDISNAFSRSSTSFEQFDGSYCPGNVSAQGGKLSLDLKKSCGS